VAPDAGYINTDYIKVHVKAQYAILKLHQKSLKLAHVHVQGVPKKNGYPVLFLG